MLENRDFADRLAEIRPSVTLALSAKAAALRAEGRDVVNMGVGEPDFDTPRIVVDAAIAALRAGQTRYTPTEGTLALRETIATKLMLENKLSYRADQIVVSNGAKQSLHNTLCSLLNPGDEVVLSAPYWVSYADVTKLCDGVVRVIPTSLKQGFLMSAEQLEDILGPKSKVVVLNSPGNPSGAMYSRYELEKIAAVLLEHPNVWVISDDIYEHILVGNKQMLNILNVCPQLSNRVVIVNGVSKAYAMTGWRIGYAATSPGLTKAMGAVQSQTSGPPNAIAQAAAIEALRHSATLIKSMVSAYRQRHEAMCNGLSNINGLAFKPSDGSFYVFVSVQGGIDRLYSEGRISAATDVEFSKYLLERLGLAVVPGTEFGSPGHLRLSFATSLDNIHSACDRLRMSLEKQQPETWAKQ